MKATTISVAAGLAALLSVSCGGHKQAQPVATAPAGIGLNVRTLERGAEPRERLRYSVNPGRTDVFALEIGLAGFVETRTGAAAVEAPVLELGVQMGPVTAIDDYTRAYPIRFRAVNVRMPPGTTPEEALEVQREIAPLAALAGTFQVDSRGLTQRAELTIPDNLSPRLMTLLGNVRTSLLTVPLPEESVGVGARWEVRRGLDVGGVRVTQTVTYTLVERVNDLLRLGVTLEQTATPQQVVIDDQGTKLAIETYAVSTVGSSILKLDHLAPLGEARGTSELRGRVTRGAEQEPVAIRGVAVVRMVPLASEAMTSAPLQNPQPSAAPSTQQSPSNPSSPQSYPQSNPSMGQSPSNPSSPQSYPQSNPSMGTSPSNPSTPQSSPSSPSSGSSNPPNPQSNPSNPQSYPSSPSSGSSNPSSPQSNPSTGPSNPNPSNP